jgi:hypothetical protein
MAHSLLRAYWPPGVAVELIDRQYALRLRLTTLWRGAGTVPKHRLTALRRSRNRAEASFDNAPAKPETSVWRSHRSHKNIRAYSRADSQNRNAR